MSFRARLEKERAEQQLEEIEKEEQRQRDIQSRIVAPLVWKELPKNIKIIDLKPDKYEEVIKIIEEQFLIEDVLTRNCHIADDEISKKSYLDRILFNLRDCKSIIAMDFTPRVIELEKKEEKSAENVDYAKTDTETTTTDSMEEVRIEAEIKQSNLTGKRRKKVEVIEEVKYDYTPKIVGFLILKQVFKQELCRVFSRVQLTEGENFHTMVKFLNYLHRHTHIFEPFNCDRYLRYYLLCILPEYRNQRYELRLMQSAQDVARSLECPVVMGCFNSYILQKCAENIGMSVLHELYYTSWRDNLGNLIFCDLGTGNYTCAIMAGQVPEIKSVVEIPPPQENKEEEEEEEIPKPKLTRTQKKILKSLGKPYK